MIFMPLVITLRISGAKKFMVENIHIILKAMKKRATPGGDRRLAFTKKSLSGPTACDSSGGGVLLFIIVMLLFIIIALYE